MWLKEKTTQEKINELNLLILTLENSDVKYSIVYNFSSDLILTINDKTSQKTNAKKVKKEKE